MSCKELSIVTTLYRSQQFVDEFYRRINEAANLITSDYELIFVDDGSPDESAEIVKSLVKQDEKVMLVELSRNFGHHYAEVAGLKHAHGRHIFLIDVDLEESPELLVDFWTKLRQEEQDVIFGVQDSRQGSFFKRYSGELFYKLFNLVSDVKIPNNLCTVRLMTREYVEALLQVKDKNLFLAGICAWTGFRQKAVSVQKHRRDTPSTYTLFRMIRLCVNAITSFSSYPLQMIFVTGFMIAGLAGILGLNMVWEKLFHPEKVLLGYASIIVSIWFLSGLIILFLGMIGMYLSKVFNEVKDRPQYLIRRIYRHEKIVTKERAENDS